MDKELLIEKVAEKMRKLQVNFTSLLHRQAMAKAIIPIISAEAKKQERERIADKAKFTIHTSGRTVIIDRDDWTRFQEALKGEGK